MNAVIDQEALKQVRPPNPSEAVAAVAVDRNKWFFVCVLMILVSVGMGFYIIKLQGMVTQNTKVAWVKMFSDGSSQVEFASPENEQAFYRINIDKTLSDYVSYRWNERSTTIKEDYGRAYVFMSKQLAGYFTAPTGFYAADKAGKIAGSPGADTVTFHVGPIDHYDTKAATTPDRNNKKRKGILNRTNLYLTRQVIGSLGESRGKDQKFILHLDWRFATQAELQKREKSYFMVNPLGIVIEEEKLELSPESDNQPDPTQH